MKKFIYYTALLVSAPAWIPISLYLGHSLGDSWRNLKWEAP